MKRPAPVDLDRKRRLAALDAEARELLTDPALASRTADALAGRIPSPPAMRPTMKQTSLRLTPDLEKRLDALIPEFANDPNIAALGEVTRSTVLRVALSRGLGVLEAERSARGKKQ